MIYPDVKASKEGDYTNSTYFYMHLGAKYMRLPNFGTAPKMNNPLGQLSWDPMAGLWG